MDDLADRNVRDGDRVVDPDLLRRLRSVTREVVARFQPQELDLPEAFFEHHLSEVLRAEVAKMDPRNDPGRFGGPDFLVPVVATLTLAALRRGAGGGSGEVTRAEVFAIAWRIGSRLGWRRAGGLADAINHGLGRPPGSAGETSP